MTQEEKIQKMKAIILRAIRIADDHPVAGRLVGGLAKLIEDAKDLMLEIEE